MSYEELRVRLPRLPEPAFFGTPDHSILTLCGGAILTYDPATRSGFIYHIGQKNWFIAAPIDFKEFTGLVVAGGWRIADGDDTQRWLRACDVRPAGSNVLSFHDRATH